MTFEYYLNRVHPAKAHGVKVKKEQCEGIWPNVVTGTFIISLRVRDDFYTYVTKPISNLLWTTDQDGNPKSPSCFILID